MRWQQTFLSAMTLLSTTAAAQNLANYCSSLNTGSDFNGIYNTYNSHSACSGNCTSAGTYAFAILQGNLCWCSNLVPASSVRESVTNCESGCPGYPPDTCGNPTDHLYGYLALGPAPAGTEGASTSAASSTAAPTTIYATSVQTVVSTEVSVSTQPTSPGSAGASSAVAPVTVISTFATTERVTQTVVPTPASPSSTPSTLVTPSIITVSNTPTTVQYITTIIWSTPAASPTATGTATGTANGEQGNLTPVSHSHSSLSGGAIAGIVIGALAGVAILAALLWLCCFRRRDGDDEESNGLTRNNSILSKVGLGRNRGNSVATGQTTNSTPAMIQRTPTAPLFQDSRLNPNIGTWRGDPAELPANPAAGLGISHDNGSQGSLASVQDHRDYSRPLAVRNPDQF